MAGYIHLPSKHFIAFNWREDCYANHYPCDCHLLTTASIDYEDHCVLWHDDFENLIDTKYGLDITYSPNIDEEKILFETIQDRAVFRTNDREKIDKFFVFIEALVEQQKTLSRELIGRYLNLKAFL